MLVDFGKEKESNACFQAIIQHPPKRCERIMLDEAGINLVEHLNRCIRVSRVEHLLRTISVESVNFLDQCRLLGKCPPTPPIS